MKRLFAGLIWLPLGAMAHEGHGMEGAAHYHATDVWGFLFIALLAVLAWWWFGSDK